MRQGILNDRNEIVSDVWVDQDDAGQRLDGLLQCGFVSESEHEKLAHFIEYGYCVVDLELDDTFCEEATRLAAEQFDQRPADLLAASVDQNQGRPMPCSRFPAAFKKGAGFRMLDAHSHVTHFRELMANMRLHRFVNLILNATPVATQSLYFEYGSTQNLHRDPWYVVTTPVSSMVAAWIALEDIDPKSGPLSYIPGSHRLKYKPLKSGDIVFHGSGVDQNDREEHIHDMWDQIREAGLKVKQFLPRRGQALIWHSSLVHGGSRVIDSEMTRKSFVIHFDELRHHDRHAQQISIVGREAKVMATDRISQKNGCVFFENPLTGSENSQLLAEL